MFEFSIFDGGDHLTIVGLATDCLTYVGNRKMGNNTHVVGVTDSLPVPQTMVGVYANLTLARDAYQEACAGARDTGKPLRWRGRARLFG